MKTITRNFVKRSISVLLVLMMVLSLLTVGLTSASAAEVELAETGASVTYAVGDYIYMKNFTPSGWSASWFYGDVYEWAHLFNSSTNASIDIKFELVEGTENAASAVYGAKITTAGTYTHVVFTRSHSETDPWNNCNQTGDIPLDATNNCYTNVVVGGTTYTGSVYNGGGSGGTTTDASFWIDLNPDDDSSDLDLLYPEKDGTKYTFYLPSYANAAKLEFHVSEGATLNISGTIYADGTVLNCSNIVNAATTYGLGGSFNGNLYIKQSANVSAIHTTTKIDVPQGTYQGYENKDDFETKGSIAVIDKDGTQKNEDTILKKIKGRGNSSWEASHKIIGKYAFNITLEEKAKLLDESKKSKKFCLVSYNADEARMRNMIVYELAQQIGVEYVADYEPVDLYNNGNYIGSYLLTDKVEIGNPLVDIVELDKINEEWGSTFDADDNVVVEGTNLVLYDDDSLMTRASSNGNINDTSTKGFYKYISNLEEPDPSTYADSGFLLEFELNERFDDEISGFISTKGQQIVCKYPEFATQNEIQFIMNKWNTAEALMYNKSATYAELDAVIDVESFAKMYLIQELTKNLDGGATSYYVYYDGGKLHAGVAWDYDWTLGQYAKTYTDRVNSGSDFYANVNANPSAAEGWYLNSKNIYGGSTFNAQAALCQNDAFWGVVTAEWNEIFYNEAIKFTNNTSSNISSIDGIIAEFYNQVKASTAMDEDKWGLIADDPFITNNWGSTDTGDNHDDAVEWLDDWMNTRLGWMNDYISIDGSNHTGIYNVDYIIQPPTIKTDKELYQAGDTAVLTIDDKTDGDFTYTIYKDGEVIGTTTDKTYEVTAGNKGVANYTVTATSNNSNKTSALSNAAKVEVEGFNFTLDVSSPVSVTLGEYAEITANTNSDELVIYTLEDAEGDIIDTAEVTGGTTFKILADKVDRYEYTVRAKTTVDGEEFSDYIDVSYEVTAFEFAVTLTGNSNVEAGLDIALKATAQSSSTVSYTFYDENDNIIAENFNGLYSKETTQEDVGKTFSYYVTAKTTVLGIEYTATSEEKTITVVPVSEVYDVTIYFKSTTSYGYWPLITTYGAVNDVEGFKMLKGDTEAIFIGKNSSQTASYYWFKADVQVSKASPTIAVSVLSSRYAMQGDLSLKITESGAIYLAVDDLNAGTALLNLTDWDEAKRNWCQSAVHMVYDDALDGEEKLASVSSTFVMRYVGDANGDGVVNIKDATLIQKSLANLATLDSTATEVSDLTSDGAVTIKDATAIQKQLAGL